MKKILAFSVCALASSAFAHDFVEDWWKSLYAPRWVGTNFYDSARDEDADGWSAYEERRAGSSPSAAESVAPNGMFVRETPVPETMVRVNWPSDAKLMRLGGGEVFSDSEHVRTISLSERGGDLDFDVVTLGGGSVVPRSVSVKVFNESDTNATVFSDVRKTRLEGDLKCGSVSVGRVDYVSGTLRMNWNRVKAATAGKIKADERALLWAEVSWKTGHRVNTDRFKCANEPIVGDAELFFDENENSKFDVGEPFFWVHDAPKGWCGNSIDAKFSRTGAALPRVDLLSGLSDREVVFKEKFRDETGAYRSFATSNYSAWASSFAGSREVPVRVIRAMVDHQPQSLTALNDRLVMAKKFDFTRRTVLHEGDFRRDGEFDLDWSNFETEVLNNQGVLVWGLPVTSVVYRVYVGGTTNEFIDVERRFEKDEASCAKPTIVSPSNSCVYGARPTFRWNMNGESDWAAKFGSSYTAFRIVVAAAESGVDVWDSGLQFAPVRDADGCFTWKAPLCAGQALTNGTRFANGDYVWRVSMYNAKFQTDKFSVSHTFVMSVNADDQMNDHGYGSVSASVTYRGAHAVSASSPTNAVCVALCRRPDFTGEVETLVMLPSVAGIASGETVTCKGVEMFSRLYAVAWIDENGNGTRDAGEPWGYRRHADSYNPKGVDVVGDSAPSVEIEIDD